MNENPPSEVTKVHAGVYGRVIQDGKVLVVKKARGPYTGLYDLPGGTPEDGETPEETLAREIKEETGLDVVDFTHAETRTIFFSDFTKESKETGVLKHTGILYNVRVAGELRQGGDGLDSNGAIWVNLKTLTSANATPFVLLCAKK